MNLPWKTKGIVLTAPLTKDVDKVVELIDTYLAPKGVNLIVMQLRYRYQFKTHPECMGYDPLSYEDVKKLVAVCKKHGIRLLPKMNLYGHQSGLPNTPTDGILHGHSEVIPDIRDGLLRAYPEFDEQPNDKAVFYARSICLTNPLVRIVLFEMVDELMEVFEADGMHIGCDEVFNLGMCEECSKFSNRELFANWINAVHDHFAENGKQVLMWSDRFISVEETGYNMCEASDNGTEGAIDDVAKDIIFCDWHYEGETVFPSVDIFAEKGFRMLASVGWIREHISNFLTYAQAHDRGHIDGVLMTTWCNSGELADCILRGIPQKWHRTETVADAIRYILEE